MQPVLRKEPEVEQLTIVCALPLYHIFALTVVLPDRAPGSAAMNLLIPNPRDIPGFVKELAKYKFNMFPAVNTLFNGLLNHPEFAKLDFSGAEGVATAAAWRCRRRWPTSGSRSPACRSSKATACPRPRRWPPCNPADVTEFTGTIGLPMPSTEIAILDDDGNPRAARPAGRDRDPRPAGDGRLLEPPGRNRQGHDRRRLLQVRRRRHHGRARLRKHRRPQEGHDPGVRLQRLSERDRRRGGRCIRACWNAPASACRTRSPARRSSCSWCARTRR